jgi:putative flippase GtrA
MASTLPHPTLVRTAVQYAKFGVIGLSATAVHVSVFSAVMELFAIAAWQANILAFTVAIIVSFLGHFHWTFRSDETDTEERRRQRNRSFPKFVFTASVGFTLNLLAAYVLVDVLGKPYVYAVLIMIFGVPPIVFALAKFWAFR